ncbi:MAG: hypothetical protein IPK75_05330 [Acidobacteria bacterium]|nr:hypothetical protein [Acidobacteriota bacterium]
MTRADTNLSKIDQRLREINRKIEALKQEQAELRTMRGDLHITLAAAGDIGPGTKNIKKLQTLGRVRSVLSEVKHPMSTTGLMSMLKQASPTNFQAVTIRSHLRRLRLEGELQFDDEQKVWLPPEE